MPRLIESSAALRRRWASGVSGTKDFPNVPGISSGLRPRDPHRRAVSLDEPGVKAFMNVGYRSLVEQVAEALFGLGQRLVSMAQVLANSAFDLL